MEKAFKYRIYPTKKQQELIQKTFGCCRFVYNYYLSVRDAAAFNFDDATKEIMDAKNKEIRDLKEENRNLRKFEMLYSSRNVKNK